MGISVDGALGLLEDSKIQIIFLPQASKAFKACFQGFPDSSVGKESAYNVGDPGSIPVSGRSAGEVIGYPLQYSWASLVTQLIKNPSAMWETWVPSLGLEAPLERGKGYPP